MRTVAVLCGWLVGGGCATGARSTAEDSAILVQSRRASVWPPAEERQPGIWFRLETAGAPFTTGELIEHLRIVVEHGHRSQVITGAGFEPLDTGDDILQSPYFYSPLSGVLFVSVHLRTATRDFFAYTQRIPLNDDCWNLLSFTVRGASGSGRPVPPPYPRTVFLTPAFAPDPPLFLDVYLSGNCFRNPLPPF